VEHRTNSEGEVSKLTFGIEREEYTDDGIYIAAQTSTFTHDTDTDEGATLDTVVETFREFVTAAGYLGAERIVLQPYTPEEDK
jgi:hypothetical protein